MRELGEEHQRVRRRRKTSRETEDTFLDRDKKLEYRTHSGDQRRIKKDHQENVSEISLNPSDKKSQCVPAQWIPLEPCAAGGWPPKQQYMPLHDISNVD